MKSMTMMLVTTFVLAGLAIPALVAASGKPSQESCANVGIILIDCYTCSKVFLGKVSTQGEYSHKLNSCVGDISKIIAQCARAYEQPNSKLRIEWKYSIGMNDYEGYSQWCN